MRMGVTYFKTKLSDSAEIVGCRYGLMLRQFSNIAESCGANGCRLLDSGVHVGSVPIICRLG